MLDGGRGSVSWLGGPLSPPLTLSWLFKPEGNLKHRFCFCEVESFHPKVWERAPPDLHFPAHAPP